MLLELLLQTTLLVVHHHRRRGCSYMNGVGVVREQLPWWTQRRR